MVQTLRGIVLIFAAFLIFAGAIPQYGINSYDKISLKKIDDPFLRFFSLENCHENIIAEINDTMTCGSYHCYENVDGSTNIAGKM